MFQILVKCISESLRDSTSHTLPEDTACLPYSLDQSFHQKPTITQLVKKFPAFYETERYIIVFTTAHHWPLSQANVSPHPPTFCKNNFYVTIPSTIIPPTMEVYSLQIFRLKLCKYLSFLPCVQHAPVI
jgi:hypothetical protein